MCSVKKAYVVQRFIVYCLRNNHVVINHLVLYQRVAVQRVQQEDESAVIFSQLVVREIVGIIKIINQLNVVKRALLDYKQERDSSLILVEDKIFGDRDEIFVL